jgi:MtN3 and saliva related transmembrane protein
MPVLIVATTIVGFLMSLGHFPQAYIMIRNKSGANVSWITYGIFAVGTLLWLIYGISISNVPIIASYAPGLVGSWLVLFLKAYYSKKQII